MNETTIKLLEFDKIKGNLLEYAVSEKAKELIMQLVPSTEIEVIENWMNETTEARKIIDIRSSVPLHSLSKMDAMISKLNTGIVLQPDELTILCDFLGCVKRLKKFMVKMQEIAPRVSAYALSMHELENLAEEINKCIQHNKIDDKASPALFKIRKKMAIIDERIKQKLENILHSPAYSKYIQDNIVSVRNGRYVIPVKKEYRKNIEGSVLDSSSSGSTLFIEPTGVRKLQEELNILKIEQENEEHRILSFLTGLVESYQQEISLDIEAMAHYDFIFAKAKYSRALAGNAVHLNTDKRIHIQNGKHPLLGKNAVPLNFHIGDTFRALIITGPNTGGKTVVLKTVGLLTMMVQSGLHVPVDKESSFAAFRDILADIGDGQSIEQSLSTFSAHLKNISAIIECADPYTLVILDELGAGTEPGEGSGLAMAVLEEIYRKKATIIATTHYNDIKAFAKEKEGFENGCMAFDIHSLKPLYKLQIGEAGASNAFLIALRLGIHKAIIEKAHEYTYKEKKDYTDVCKNLTAAPVINDSVVKSHAQKIDTSQKVQENRKKIKSQKSIPHFKIGDCVYISSMNRTGIVCELENGKGEVGVMVMKKKLKINKKRLSLYIDSKELYPDQYDMDIVLESKENRKKKHLMKRKYVDGLTIEYTDN